MVIEWHWLTNIGFLGIFKSCFNWNHDTFYPNNRIVLRNTENGSIFFPIHHDIKMTKPKFWVTHPCSLLRIPIKTYLRICNESWAWMFTASQEYAHVLLFCCGYVWFRSDQHIYFSINSLASQSSYYCSNVSETTLTNVGKWLVLIH